MATLDYSLCFAGATSHQSAFQESSSQWNCLAKMLEADVQTQPYLLQGKLHPYQMQVSLVKQIQLGAMEAHVLTRPQLLYSKVHPYRYR